jgi:ATP-grasp domain-containing protein
VTEKPILLVGSPRDATTRHTVSVFRHMRCPFEVLNLDSFANQGAAFGELSQPLSVVVAVGQRRLQLGDYRSIYARYDSPPSDLSEVERSAWVGRSRVLQSVIDAASNERLVVNRPGAGSSNGSKPHQTSLLQRYGFNVPRSLTTNCPAAADAFIKSCVHGAIYKSNSGIRSIVEAADGLDSMRLRLLPTCPVLFQERIRGANIRVHVVRDRCYCLSIRSSLVDYRYDDSGTIAERVIKLPQHVERLCIDATDRQGLAFSGIDLLHSDDDDEFYALEVNPMPGYHSYDHAASFAISRGLCELLRHGEPPARVGSVSDTQDVEASNLQSSRPEPSTTIRSHGKPAATLATHRRG